MNLLSNIPAFLLTIGVLVVIHEYGHYRVAVACGVKVLRFSVGFGRVLWRRQPTPDGTEFVICAIPLGGYVKMLDEREAPVAPDELSRSFNRKPLLQRAAIVAAGPVANLLLAVLLYAAAHWIGIDEPKAVMGPPVAASLAERAGLRSGDWAREWSSDGVEWHELRSMSDLRWEVTQAVVRGAPLQLMVTDRAGHARRNVSLALDTLGTSEVDAKLMQRIGLGYPFSEPVLGEVRAGEPAARAGLRSGDRVLSIDGVPMADAFAVRDTIRRSGRSGVAKTMQWHIERGGQTLELAVTPAIVSDGSQQVGRIGVAPGQPPEMANVRYGVFEGLSNAVTQTWQMSALTLKMLGKMLIGQASLKNLSGPLTIADVAGQSMRLGLADYLNVLAVVSIGLGVLNLLPLPVLDGGHLMYYLFEGVTGKPVSELWLDRLQRGGVAIMLMMMSLALYNDVARLLGLQ
jgi:regulator of sigma E protease